MPVSTVCISHATGASGEEVGRLVADALGFRYVDEQILIAAADVAIDAPGANLTLKRARLERRGRELWVWPLKS